MSTRRTKHAAGVLLTFLLTSGCAVSSGLGDPVNPVRDKEGLALNRHRLEVAVADLNAITDPTYAHATGRARATGCTVDSGEVFEPSADREWTLTGPARDNTDPESVSARPLTPTHAGQQAMEDIAGQLLARGWTGSARVRHLYSHDKHGDGVYVIHLRKTFSDHRVDLGIQGFSDSILASLSTAPRHVCNHAS